MAKMASSSNSINYYNLVRGKEGKMRNRFKKEERRSKSALSFSGRHDCFTFWLFLVFGIVSTYCIFSLNCVVVGVARSSHAAIQQSCVNKIQRIRAVMKRRDSFGIREGEEFGLELKLLN